jgi:hypothetical protein
MQQSTRKTFQFPVAAKKDKVYVAPPSLFFLPEAAILPLLKCDKGITVSPPPPPPPPPLPTPTIFITILFTLIYSPACWPLQEKNKCEGCV